MIAKCLAMILIIFFLLSTIAYAEENVDIDQEKITLYKQIEAITLIPWYYLAAINRYEANISDKEPDIDQLIAISISEEKWYGLSPNKQPMQEEFISLFGGMGGKDGNGDDIADPANDYDTLYTMAMYIQQQGYTTQDIRTALWNYYKRELTVLSIMNYAELFKTYQKISLDDTAFPIPKSYNYSYRNTWGGDARGFGGRRIHEGTDIFAGYGTPVRATTYGVIELKGWNKFGGWRIGIRDIYNRYHYYAHLNGFADGLEIGDIVEAGQTIGSVGSSGYGPPGTSGKFPPPSTLWFI
ncbi:cell wall endopeptidase [Gracilibacillus boraciitolerans JCM 21714]|uniref:Cell wall endopeptidase n=1 Tax=Gracilibacillus boraciitolerans JCM 21714 TaxID=1298598 RepID=W4VI32_9BACI|nr:cell wall endopeptidase [Gracilibacillus boraciitolerans JCM 21714]